MISTTRVFSLFLGFGVIGLASFSSLLMIVQFAAQSSSTVRTLSTVVTTITPPNVHYHDEKTPLRSSILLLPREEQRGSWIGDVWIPPKAWTLYSVLELAQLWGESTKGILWIGDSTARRSSLTMWEILNNYYSTTEQQNHTTSAEGTTSMDIPKDFLEANEHINVNHQGHAVEKCTSWPRIRGADICRTLTLPTSSSALPHPTTLSRPFVFKRLNCYHEVIEFLEHELSRDDSVLNHVDTIILSLGLWDITMEHQCFPTEATTSTSSNTADSIRAFPAQERQKKLLDSIQHLPERFTILWRTTSYANPEDVAAIDRDNKNAMDTMDRWWTVGSFTEGRPTVHYVDFARAIFSRSFGKERIQGDHYAHYGSTARVVMIQMLSNRLRDLKRGKLIAQQSDGTMVN